MENNNLSSEGDRPALGSVAVKPKVQKTFWQKLGEIGTISNREVVEFTRHLSVMLEAGVTIFEAIKFLKKQSRNKVFQSKLEIVLENLNNGKTLSDSMRRFPKVFPQIYVNIISVGEQSGTLAKTMADLADHMEESQKFKSKIKGALIYPKIILSIMVIFMLVILLFVMPRILTIFKSLDAEIPLATRVMIRMTEIANDHVVALLGGLVGFILLIYFALKNNKVQRFLDRFYLKIPVIGRIVLNYNTTQVSQHFGTLFASGITILKCLEITSNVMANHVFREELNFMVGRIRSGVAFSQSFREKTSFPPMFVKLINVGERTGKLPQVIDYLRGYYKGLVDEDVKNITSIIEPLIMVLLGLMVAGLVVTVIGPIYQLISNVTE